MTKADLETIAVGQKVIEHETLKREIAARMAVLSDVFQSAFDAVEADVGKWMKHQGFNGATPGEEIALMHTELSEAMEALRHNRWTGADSITEELADTIIRIMHFASKHEVDLSHAILAKILKNLERPFKHNKAL